MKGVIFSVLAALALVGCGGGGGGDNEPVQTGASQAAGTYQGQTNDGFVSFALIVLQNGDFYLPYSQPDGIGFLYGRGKTTASTFKVSGIDYGSAGERVPFSLSATYRSGLSLAGNLTEDGQTKGFTATYTSSRPISPAALAGTYQGTYLTNPLAGFVTLTINAAGAVTATDQNDCNLSGMATQSAGVIGVYDVSLTYEDNPTNCGSEFAGQTVAGVASIDDDSDNFYAFMTSKNGTLSVIFEGTNSPL